MNKKEKKIITLRKEGNKVYVNGLLQEIIHAKKAVLKELANR